MPLIRVLPPRSRFYEPCAGSGELVTILQDYGHHCVGMCDIEPDAPHIARLDAARLTQDDVEGADAIITNPPFRRDMLEPLMDRWLGLNKPLWLLLPIDMLCNAWWAPYAPHIAEIVPIGRIRWIPGSKNVSKDNFAWVRFDSVGDWLFFRPRLRNVN